MKTGSEVSECFNFRSTVDRNFFLASVMSADLFSCMTATVPFLCSFLDLERRYGGTGSSVKLLDLMLSLNDKLVSKIGTFESDV